MVFCDQIRSTSASTTCSRATPRRRRLSRSASRTTTPRRTSASVSPAPSTWKLKQAYSEVKVMLDFSNTCLFGMILLTYENTLLRSKLLSDAPFLSPLLQMSLKVQESRKSIFMLALQPWNLLHFLIMGVDCAALGPALGTL